MKLSHSKIKCYAGCGLRYDFKYNLKLPVETDNINLDFGSAVHKSLELFHIALNDEDPGSQYLLDEYEKEWEEVVLLGDSDVPDKLFYSMLGLGRKMLSKYYVNNKGTQWFEPPISTEFYFSIPAIDWDTGEVLTTLGTGKDGKECLVELEWNGVIDLILFYEGKIYIIDHKTAKNRYSEFKINTDMQLTLYYYAGIELQKMGKIPEGEIGVGFNLLQKTKEPNIERYLITRDEGDYRRLLASAKLHLQGMQNKVYAPNNIGNNECGWCSYREPCQLWGRHGDKWLDVYLQKRKDLGLPNYADPQN